MRKEECNKQKRNLLFNLFLAYATGAAPGFPLQVRVPLCSSTVGFPLQPLTRNGT